MVEASIFPTMGNLVDLRRAKVYGTVYAITNGALCLGYSLGTSTSTFVVVYKGLKRFKRKNILINLEVDAIMYAGPAAGGILVKAIGFQRYLHM